MLSNVYLEFLTALAFLAGGYAPPAPATEPVFTLPEMPPPIVVWYEGSALLTGHYEDDGPNSTRLVVDSIEGAPHYTVICDQFTAHTVSAANAIAVLNGPDACRVA